MSKPLTIQEFMAMFPNDDACLEHLFKARYGTNYECDRCGERGKWKKLAKMPAYTCQCGNHIHPMVGTPFHRSHTPLQKWFYAMYLFTTTRHGVPAKELQRQLSVNYKTAWRMGHEIRKYLGYVDGDPPLGGHVEADDTMVGGHRKMRKGQSRKVVYENKTIVLGVVERGGTLKTEIVPDTSVDSLEVGVTKTVIKGSVVSTDEHPSFADLGRAGFEHGTVHHGNHEYRRGKHHTNTIEGFWSMLKRSIKGTHIHVSARHLPKYLAEFEFRWNLRHDPAGMFPRLLRRLAT